MSDSRPRSTSLHTPLGRRRLLLSLSTFLLLLLAPHNLAKAIKCIAPTATSAFSTGENITVAWSVSLTDGYIYDSIDAELYCLDVNGTQQDWRALSTLYSAKNIQYPEGQFQSKMPNCGPAVTKGAIRIIMSGFYGVLQTDDACVFNILSTNRLTPNIIMPSPTTPDPKPTSTLDKGNPSTSSAVTQPTSNPIAFTGGTTVPTSTEPTIPILSTNYQLSPTTNPTGTTSPPSSSPSSSEDESSTIGPNIVHTSSIPVPSGLPALPPLPPNHGGSTGTEGPKSEGAKTIGAVIGTIGMAAALAVVVVSLILVRRRRKRQRMAGEGSMSSLGPSITGRGGRVMKEKKRKGLGLFGGGRHGSNESGGHFMQMDSSEDEEDDLDLESQDAGEKVPRLHAVAGGVGVNAVGKSEILESEAEHVVQREMASIATTTPTAARGSESPMETTVAMPPHVFMDPTVPNRRRYSLPMTESSAYSMSSLGSSFGASSVVRQYWAASEAARAERRRDTYSGRSMGSEDYYTEGSIFGDRDSESRMADIVSRTENGSFATFTTRRQRDHSLERRWAQGLDRRNTLGSSIGDSSSLQRTTTMTMSFSSVPSSMDSEEYREQVYLDRLHMQALRMREQEMMMLHEHQMRQQQYYDHRPQYHHHPHDPHLLHQHHHHYLDTMGSRRSSSVPSLTSTNDPFKTFDSNEILMDTSSDPFSDSRAVTPVQFRDMDDSLPPV
ncbi:hypothetical protein BGZ52_009341 [Haplosporangium bisporale]|nr:hypothetical protein BGZ52_009341 [Haplosporangium bisporale]KFH70569.1 hypothetical protein MVEG_03419 [Podila verticillata NRRL 6337]